MNAFALPGRTTQHIHTIPRVSLCLPWAMRSLGFAMHYWLHLSNSSMLDCIRFERSFSPFETKSETLVIISYNVVNGKLNYSECHFKRIESFDWSCLTLGALGWGQIQIANANKLFFVEQTSRKSWMLSLCDKLEAFYDEEIGKIGERKLWFSNIKDYWENR